MSGALESWTGLSLESPGLLWLALLVPAALAWRRHRGLPAIAFSPAALLGGGSDAGVALPKTWRVRLLALPAVLHVLALLLACFALARPVEREPLPLKAEGIDILLCLDTSSSMAARDLDAERSRLDVARAAAEAFIAGRPGDRIGLVRFARFPDLRCPLTLDHRALRELLSRVEPVEREGPEDATAIGTAVARAAQALQGGVAGSSVVVVLTDGEENVATAETPEEIAPIHAAQLCKEMGIRVYTIAAGSGQPDGRGGWTKLDTGQIRRLAEKTGGRFFEARDAGALEGVYAEISRLEKVELDQPRFIVIDRFLPFLLLAIGLAAVGRLLGSTVLEVLP